jgi:hypothetical protein
MSMVRARRLVLAVVAALLTAAPAQAKLLAVAPMPAAMAPTPDGGLVYGELASGRIYKLSRSGHRARRPRARVRVATNGLRGLLGLAVDGRGRIFADWTGRDRLIHVAQVWPGRAREVWSPGRHHSEANGGRLAFAPGGRLIVTVGDGDRSLQGDVPPVFPHFSGGIYSVDPDAGPDQAPVTLASGYFNPFGLAITPSGDIWTTDNAITPTTDLIARVHDGTPEPFRYMSHAAPSGLAAIDDMTLAVCGYASRRLDRFAIGPDGTARRVGKPIARDCEVGVIRLADGRLAYANTFSINVVRP